MRRLPPATDERVLVGYGTADDAGVLRLRDDLALVQTVDFFTPIVDDPYDFGRIAAANSFSDVYAMGGTPVSALNVVAFPAQTLPLDVLDSILAGGAAIAKQAGVSILGGHTIKDAEPKYGMAVTGTIHPHAVVTNANARPGDILMLTKPLGTGVLSTALKQGECPQEILAEAVGWMAALNDRASRAMVRAQAHAATDVTGYGLLGHAHEMARASGVALHFQASAIPIMPGVLHLIDSGMAPSGTIENAAAHAAFVRYASDVADSMRIALSDAQTSGGLLVALAPENVQRFTDDLRGAHALAAIVGEVRQGEGITVR